MNVDWQQIFLNDLDGRFALEIVFRTVVMFLVVLVILRLSGKRGVRQLSVFELAIILSLGSAAGDSMFYKDVAILTTVIVCFTAIGFYRIITWVVTKNKQLEGLLEGKPVYIVEDGVMTIKGNNKNSLSKDEFFAELRGKGVEHLGQVKVAILETDGNISVFFHADENVKSGLPILPHYDEKHVYTVKEAGSYACIFCGTLHELHPGRHHCSRCNRHEWVAAIDTKRIT